ncbi:aminopeptidase N [Pyruvatibacter sp. HU-CL02332]|uniref:aminopeptidase N n=1 Tax=Pyruvatibacter sp. HU-CL02332 TaxID=3127650 RepID=UPI003365AF42
MSALTEGTSPAMPPAPSPIHLADYAPPPWLVDTVALDVQLAPTATRVTATTKLKPNPEAAATTSIELDGERMQLISVSLDGHLLGTDAYTISDSKLTLHDVTAEPHELVIESECDPQANTSLTGLYRSSGVYCTQCEAEGFRRITYFPDRPDVLAIYTVRLEADKTDCPILLANGNQVAQGDLADGRHFAEWHDPHPKPAYLFAMVAGDLDCVSDRFTTMSGRDVSLGIYVEHGKADRTAYAMDSLKRSMTWDEAAFGREYDLDVFNIVAVSDFNMGAMENKGLNVFNDKYILVRPDTATDADYANVEAIIAHEYFHNWSGNRVTCRDWFQLCLKEGLTVFRDQEFSSDMRSRPVKRIADVKTLRAHQYPEDAGPLAHPVRPSSYIEINNFYTATVYEKGAEVVRMLKTLIGPDAFRDGMDAYFENNDGRAATVEDFISAMEDASGRDLSQFKRWYDQAGTPELVVSGKYSPIDETFDLTVAQSTAPTPGQSAKAPLHIPLAMGLIGKDGTSLPLHLSNTETDGDAQTQTVVELTGYEQTFTFEKVTSPPVLSVLRGFSAPVKLTTNGGDKDWLFRMAHDPDPCARWEAGQTYARELLVNVTRAMRAGDKPRRGTRYADALRHVLEDDSLEPAFAAMMLDLPGEAELAQHIGQNVDADAVHNARKHLQSAVADQLGDLLLDRYSQLQSNAAYSPDAEQAGRRALKNACLRLYAGLGNENAARIAAVQFSSANNMTDMEAALATLTHMQREERQVAFDAFYERAAGDPLLLDKWFSLQAMSSRADTRQAVEALMDHSDFSMKRPNTVRSLIGVFAGSNPVRFHAADGSGYRLLTQVVRDLDPINPQVAARLLGTLKSWRVYDDARKSEAVRCVSDLLDGEKLSEDVYEIATRMIA